MGVKKKIFFNFLYKKWIFIGVQLLYNAVLVSPVQQSEPAEHISPLFWISFTCRSPESTDWASLAAQLVKNLPAMQEIEVLIPGLGRPPGEGIGYPLQYSWASLLAQEVKNLPAVWETWVRSLGQEDPLDEGMATHSSTLAWRIPGTGEPGGLQSMGSQRVGHDWATKNSTEHWVEFSVRYSRASNKIVKSLKNQSGLCKFMIEEYRWWSHVKTCFIYQQLGH